MVLPLKRHPGVRLPKNRPSGILRGFLGHKIRLEIHEIRERAELDQRRGRILRNLLQPLAGVHPDRPVQCHRHNNREQANRPGGVSPRHVQNPHNRMFLKLRLHVAVQEPDVTADHVRAHAGRLPQNGTRNLLVHR